MVLTGAVVPEESGFAARVEDDDVDAAVIVQVVEGSAAAAAFNGQPVPGASGDGSEFPVACILEEDVAGLVTSGVIPKLDIILEMTAGNEDVAVAVVVKIDEADSPSDLVESAGASAGDVGHVLEMPDQVAVEDGHCFW
jgi:hypothetical protein